MGRKRQQTVKQPEVEEDDDDSTNGSANGTGTTGTVQLSFTPTEQRIIDLLSDGQPHHRSELMGCLSDDLAKDGNFGAHLTAIRKKLGTLTPQETVLCVLVSRRICYRRVALMQVNS